MLHLKLDPVKDAARIIYAKGLYRIPAVGPFLDGLRANRARQNTRKMIADLEEYRQGGRQIIHFLHIGKTGGTAIKEALREYAVGDDRVLALHLHSCTLQKVPPHESVVFFLRDPVKRFVSGFLNQQRQGLPRYFSGWRPEERLAFERFGSPNELALALSSRDMEVRDAAVHAMRSIRHVRYGFWSWLGPPEYFMSRLSDILFVGFQERLSEDFERLRGLLALPEGIKLPIDNAGAHSKSADCSRRLDPEAVRNLVMWYAVDYQFLNLCHIALGVDLPDSLTADPLVLHTRS